MHYLNSRFFQFPEGVRVSAREGGELGRGHKHSFLREVTGMKFWLEENSLHKDTLQLTNGKVHWWILDESKNLDSHGRTLGGGHIAALYDDELYDLETGRSAVSRLQNFGITFGHKRIVLYF